MCIFHRPRMTAFGSGCVKKHIKKTVRKTESSKWPTIDLFGSRQALSPPYLKLGQKLKIKASCWHTL